MTGKEDRFSVFLGKGRPILDKYQYPFENVVFEGGPNKLLPFCGSVKALEESGVWKQVKRLAGSGTGAIIASLLALDFTSYQLEKLFQDDLVNIIKDRTCGQCCLCCVPSSYNPGKSILKWLGVRFKECTGKNNVTFSELQKRFSKELCVVVTNLTEGRLDYHHAKTTPDLPVIESVRMSLATPILMESIRNQNKTLKTENLFVEGGTLCNYPIHAYDGWWLSLEPEHAFLKKLPNLNSTTPDRFALFNQRTIGFVTCDDASSIQLPTTIQDQLLQVESALQPENTQLFRNITKLVSQRAAFDTQYAYYVSLANQFLKHLDETKLSLHDTFSRDDLRHVFTVCQLSDNELNMLFGTSQATVDNIFRQLTSLGKKEQLSVEDVHKFFERRRSELREKSVHTKSRKLTNNIDKLNALSDLQHLHILKSQFLNNSRNIERTIVIQTHYIGPTVHGKLLTDEDKRFLVEQGENATRYFLEQFVKKMPLLKDEGERASFNREDLKQFIDDDVSEVIDEKDYMESYLEKVL